MKSPITYYGGKTVLAKTIVEHAPQKFQTYMEPFFGSGAVFFRKRKWAKMEIINDINWDVVNFFRVLRDKPKPLIEALQLTPHARREIQDSTHFIKSARSSDVKRALYFFVRANQSFSANMSANGGWQLPTGRKNPSQVWKNKTDPSRLYALAERLRDVAIENNEALYIMKLYDNPHTFVYLDPPYLSVNSEKDKQSSYQDFNMDETAHEKLIETVLSMRSMMIISGYDHILYQPLTDNGWRKIEIPFFAASGNKKDKKSDWQRLEILWISPNIETRRAAQISLF